MSNNPKTTDAEIDKRVSEIVSLLRNHAQRRNILQYSSKAEWGVSDRTIDEYISRATEIIKTENKDDRDAELQILIGNYKELYMIHKQNQQYELCRRVMKDLSDLLGFRVLNVKAEHKVNVYDKRLVEYMDSKDIDALFDRIKNERELQTSN